MSRSSGFDLHRWWKEAVIYQIYPASFKDSNRDGWGDIEGITSKLDYLKELGVDMIWISPVYKSPQVDMGYDISDYKDIDPIYGTLADVDQLINELDKRKMKLMMDVVFNHTSDEHAWFVQSRSSLTNAKRDWYIWKKPVFDAEGNPQPPNNWSQILGEANSAWTYDQKTREYYLSLFTPEQPDLNWENEEVRAAVYDVMHFWLKRGVRGFRLDVINLISKDQSFPDAHGISDDKLQSGVEYYANGPRLHEFLKEMHRQVLSKYDVVTVGEMPWVDSEDEIITIVGSNQRELNMIFIFDMVDIDAIRGEPRFSIRDWRVQELKQIINRWQRVMIERDGWNALFLENHDNPRSVSRYVDDGDGLRERGAKFLAMMHFTVSGTLFLYQGQELGLRNVPKSWTPEDFKDVESVNLWKKYNTAYPGDVNKLTECRSILHRKARDNARTPMQWSSTENAGFAEPGVEPWMRVNEDYRTFNVQNQNECASSQPSVLQFWRSCLALRKQHSDVFLYGDFRMIDLDHETVLAYIRTGSKGEQWLVVLNFSGETVEWTIPQNVRCKSWHMGNLGPEHLEKALEGSVTLLAWEGLLGVCA